MTMAADLLDSHAELAAEALDGVAFQSAAAARFLRRGDDIAAVETCNRILSLFKEFVRPEMRVIAAAIDPVTREAATEWREERDKSLKTTRAA